MTCYQVPREETSITLTNISERVYLVIRGCMSKNEKGEMSQILSWDPEGKNLFDLTGKIVCLPGCRLKRKPRQNINSKENQK